jgi:hypothetical protein
MLKYLAIAAAPLALSACSSDIVGPRANAQDTQVSRAKVDQDLQFPTYGRGDILDEAENFFGQGSAEIAEVIRDVFEDQGQPQAYIAGEQVGGAVGVGVTYGRGMLYRPNQRPIEVYWQGPSIGFDVGADASKVFTLVYNLGPTQRIYQRIPGGEGNIYFIGGVGAQAMTNGDLTIVPIRTGIGARTGVAVEYLHFSNDRNWIPF